MGGVVAVTALVAAPVATAHKNVDGHFSLRGSNGYRISVDAHRGAGEIVFGKGREPMNRDRGLRFPPGDVTVSVEKDEAYSDYSVPGKVTGKRIRARLGRFGRISVRFHPHQRGVVDIGRHCTGRIPQQFGGFTGTIRFRGEDGYTEVHARRAKGRVIFPAPFHCHGGAGGGNHFTALDARAGPTDFAAFSSKPSGRTFFLANTFDQRRRVSIYRSAFVSAPSATFSFNPGLTSAHVEPPAPFVGTADFAAPHAWTGTLSVSFPGEPDVPFAGPDFKARLKRY